MASSIPVLGTFHHISQQDGHAPLKTLEGLVTPGPFSPTACASPWAWVTGKPHPVLFCPGLLVIKSLIKCWSVWAASEGVTSEVCCTVSRFWMRCSQILNAPWTVLIFLFSFSIWSVALGNCYLWHVTLPRNWPVPGVWAAGERLPHGAPGRLPREGLRTHASMWAFPCWFQCGLCRQPSAGRVCQVRGWKCSISSLPSHSSEATTVQFGAFFFFCLTFPMFLCAFIHG